MLDQNFLNVLNIVYSNFEGPNIDWFLFGSTNLALKGMEVVPSDLDICIKMCDLEIALAIFSDYSRSDVWELKNREALAFEVIINDVKVHICADYECGFYYKIAFLGDNIEFIKVGDYTIPSLKLQAEIEGYKHLGRNKKAAAIKEFIKRA
ncbi:hypothetical protein HN446_01920 [bacterium]|nr:hypothetical protein [bacterium]